MAYVLRGEGPERDAFRLVYKRRLENLGLKLRSPGPDVEARSALSWPKAELLINEISHLHQERSELRREKQQLQKRGLGEAQVVESQLETAKQRAQQTRERRDALKKLASSGPALVSKGDILQAEQNISKKVEALRRETEELAQRRQDLFTELKQSQSVAQGQGLVTSELRQLSAQQAQSCSLQVELKVLRDKLRRSEREREDLHLKHVELTAQFQTALAVARKEVSDMSTRLKQELLQEDDVADCLGEASERLQVQIDAATASQHRESRSSVEPTKSLEAPKSFAHLKAPSLLSGEDELKSNLSSALRQIGDLKQRVQQLQAEKAGLQGRLKHQRSKNRLRKISGLIERHQARAAMAPQRLASYKEDMEEVKRLFAMPVATSTTSATCATSVVQRVLEAFNQEVPCHSVDLASLLMGPDDAYVVSAVMQLIQSEVKRQARAIHSSLTASRSSGSGAMEEVVGRLQQMQKQLLLEVVSSTEDEDDEIWDLELHLALLVGRRDEVLQTQDGTQRDNTA